MKELLNRPVKEGDLIIRTTSWGENKYEHCLVIDHKGSLCIHTRGCVQWMSLPKEFVLVTNMDSLEALEYSLLVKDYNHAKANRACSKATIKTKDLKIGHVYENSHYTYVYGGKLDGKHVFGTLGYTQDTVWSLQQGVPTLRVDKGYNQAALDGYNNYITNNPIKFDL